METYRTWAIICMEIMVNNSRYLELLVWSDDHNQPSVARNRDHWTDLECMHGRSRSMLTWFWRCPDKNSFNWRQNCGNMYDHFAICEWTILWHYILNTAWKWPVMCIIIWAILRYPVTQAITAICPLKEFTLTKQRFDFNWENQSSEQCLCHITGMVQGQSTS